MRLFAEFMPVHFFAQPVVTLMGLGIAVDYGLFMVSRFREEIAEGYDTEAAVRRTVMTSGRTIMFSAVILVASSVPLLLFPQGFLKSITYAIIASVMLAAILSITVLAAALAILGPRVDALGVSWLLKFAQPDPIASAPGSPRTNTFALASIPAGLLLPPVGIALGHIARKRIKADRRARRAVRAHRPDARLHHAAGGLAYGVVAMKDADVIGSALYWVMLGVVIFVTVVVVGVALARYVPLARTPIVWWLNWLAEKTQKTKTRAEVETGLLGQARQRRDEAARRLRRTHCDRHDRARHPARTTGSRRYQREVPAAGQPGPSRAGGFRQDLPRVPHRTADVGHPEHGWPAGHRSAGRGDPQQGPDVPGFIEPDGDPAKMWQPRGGDSSDASVRVIQNGLVDRNDAAKKIDELRAISPPRGLTISVGGTPALEQDSIHSLFDRLPLMVSILIITTTILMFLAFGSVVLPIKAAVMSALTLGSTMGVLTWMFVDGHGAGLMNYTPQPLMAPMIGLIIAVIWGLSTDYEVFLVSRMVEARERGMSTAEAIRIGTATTGRLITGAALVLAVVAGAFVFSDLVMMKYLAFGLLIALLLDATIVRMFLVPAIMKLLGDDCWWAPRWMKRIQERLGLGETELPDERKRPAVRDTGRGVGRCGCARRAAATRAARSDPSGRRGCVPPRCDGARRGTAADERAIEHGDDAYPRRTAAPPTSRRRRGCPAPRTGSATR